MGPPPHKKKLFAKLIYRPIKMFRLNKNCAKKIGSKTKSGKYILTQNMFCQTCFDWPKKFLFSPRFVIGPKI